MSICVINKLPELFPASSEHIKSVKEQIQNTLTELLKYVTDDDFYIVKRSNDTYWIGFLYKDRLVEAYPISIKSKDGFANLESAINEFNKKYHRDLTIEKILK